MSEKDKVRVVELVKLAASSHSDDADLPTKVHEHFMRLAFE